MAGGTVDVGAPREAALETLHLIRRYVLQETVTPLKGVAKQAGLQLAGALLVGIGLVVCCVAVLRVLQGETGSVFAGSWNFAPYLLTAAVAVAVIGFAFALGLRSRGQR